jgi:hypothetical protein
MALIKLAKVWEKYDSEDAKKIYFFFFPVSSLNHEMTRNVEKKSL